MIRSSAVNSLSGTRKVTFSSVRGPVANRKTILGKFHVREKFRTFAFEPTLKASCNRIESIFFNCDFI